MTRELSADLAIPREAYPRIYERLRLIRRFEERVLELFYANEIPGSTHVCIGQEAVAVGVGENLRQDDLIGCTHRGHGQIIAKGADLRRMMAEIYGRTTGFNAGRGGSFHIVDLEGGILGATGIIGANVPHAVGAAWAAKREGSDRVVISFLGDGAINEGVVHESFNLAAIWRVPVVFVCENNQYACTLPIHKQTAKPLFERASSYGFPSHQVDGMKVEDVYGAARDAIDRARRGEGPTFIECVTYRFEGHHAGERFLKLKYRLDSEVDSWRERDPIKHWVTTSQISDAERAEADARVEMMLDVAVDFARESPEPSPEDALKYAYVTRAVPGFPLTRVGIG
jgi:pyruvate dehydrogenase E1 component alpha subunit